MPPLRLLPLLLCALLAALAAPSPAVAAKARTSVVGGASASPGQYPWTVALVAAGRAPVQGQFCGGTLIDPRVVLTAAHCVEGLPPAAIRVLGGQTRLSAATPANLVDVTSIAVHPEADAPWTDLRGDLALLRLRDPVPGAAAIRLADAEGGAGDAAWQPGDELVVTGWGRTSAATPTPEAPGTYPDLLQWVAVHRVADVLCGAPTHHGSAFDAGTMLCAGDPGEDACPGDSGGPLTTRGSSPTSPAGWTLVGVTSFGTPVCGDRSGAGVYARVAAPALRPFAGALTDPGATPPVPQPFPTARPVLGGTLEVGATVSCSGGAWGDVGGSTRYALGLYPTTDGPPLATGAGTELTHTLRAADAGLTLQCIAIATTPGGGGYGLATSTERGPVAAAPTVPAPTEPAPVEPAPVEPAPAVPATPVRPPATIPAPSPGADGAAPTARLLGTDCRRRVCTLRVQTTDRAPSSGIARLQAWVCRGARACSPAKGRPLNARPAGGGRHVLRTPRLPRGTVTLALRATDRAGNRQAPLTQVRLRVR